MKRNLLRISLLVVVSYWMTTSFTTAEKVDLSQYIVGDMELCYTVPTEDEVIVPLTADVKYDLYLGKSYVGFKEALGFKESRGDYGTVNVYGYLGKYQFAASTLEMIGVYNPNRFMHDAKLQEAAFSAYTARNKWILRRDIARYNGRYINGVKVTESGILAAAHLAGAGNVKKYLRSGGTVGFSDAFGTSIQYYLKKFSGYDTSCIEADKKARVL